MLGTVCHIKCIKIFFLVTTVYSHKCKNRIGRNKKTFQHNFFVVILVSDLWKQIGKLFPKWIIKSYQIL